MKKPWGEFVVLDLDIGYKVKRLVVKPRAQLSLQSHKHRAEVWTVVRGVASVIQNDGKEWKYGKGESIYIPINSKHRLSNHEREELIVIEVQIGDYLGEDDITRFEDKYGRIE